MQAPRILSSTRQPYETMDSVRLLAGLAVEMAHQAPLIGRAL
jgi:hypothetical protein